MTAQQVAMTLYSPRTDPKYQSDAIPPVPVENSGLVVSPDTQRTQRLPAGQHRTRKWPVLHAGSVPVIDPNEWSLSIDGLVNCPMQFSPEQFRKLPRARVYADFHCVTAWSRLGNLWEGASVPKLLELCEPQPDAKFLVVSACDDHWTTNLPLSEAMQPDVLLADTHDGVLLDADHGGPVRLVVPQLFAWKSAKWVCRITLTTDNQPGYWERLGYHDVGNPWLGQRRRETTPPP
ncbi:MAG: molybdopterin-dependent oxidoreductase [Planctomycetaceae bacterium]|nr:molybdopterin-dependent oxidoreductase [Planctomycetaceae bacterium]